MRAPSLLLVALACLAACQEGPTITAERVRSRPVAEATPLSIEARGMRARAPDPPRHECEPDQVRACWASGGPLVMPAAGGGAAPVVMHCRRGWDGVYRFSEEDCATPLVVVFDSRPVEFTRPGGDFTIGPYARTEWVSARTPWLGLDRDGSGCIEDERELFGPPEDGAGANGFDKLARLDDDGDGVVDARDGAFGSLLLWADGDEDRRCAPSEVTSLADAGIVALSLDYAPSPPGAPAGSREGERGALLYRARSDGSLRAARIVDVYLAPLPRSR